MRVSASQISSFRACRRQWSFRSRDKLSTPAGAGAQLGSDVHAELERYLKGGSINYSIEAGNIAAEGLEYLPMPLSKPYTVEGSFELEAPDDILYTGRIDLEIPGDPPTILDHKTSKNLRFVKSPEELRGDPQAIIYGAHALTRYESSAVDLVWVYYDTGKSKRSKRVHLRMLKDEVITGFEKVHLTALTMQDIVASGVPTLELPPSPEACEMFGGCPFRADCNLSPAQRRKSIMTQSANDFLSRLKSQVTGTAAAPTMPEPPSMPKAPELPKWATDAVDPRQLTRTLQPINPPAPIAAPAPAPVPLDLSVPVSFAATMTASANVSPEKPKRGRPKKEADTIPAPSLPENAAQTTQAFRFDTVYVDCMPLNENVSSVASYLPVIQRLIEEEYQVEDWRAVPYVSGAAFCKALLAIADRNIVVESGTAEGAACLTTLLANAGRVVRGI